MNLDPLILPRGYGFRRPTKDELRAKDSLMDCVTIFERPRRKGPRRYIVAADVADGIGLDRSVIQVIRCGTIQEPTEQVAEYVSDQVLPAGLAYTLQTLGQWYVDLDGYEAEVAVECNNSGLATQNTLQLHLGYSHLFIWEYLDGADASSRFSRRIGWWTTPRTRPMLLSKFHDALKTFDPVSGLPDFLTHSALLHEELRDFQTDGALWEASAAAGAHDDCIMSAAIGYYVSWLRQAGETEPLEERRRRRSEQIAHNTLVAAAGPTDAPNGRNTPMTADEHQAWISGETLDEDTLYDPRAHDDAYY